MSNDLTEIQEMKVDLAKQVLVLLFFNKDMTVPTACEAVGITERQYRYWLRNGHDAINEVRTLIDATQHDFLAEVSAAKYEIARLMIKDALSPLTKPIDRAILFERLNEISNELETVYHAKPGIEEEAQAFLKQGPRIERKESRFASIDVEETDSGFRIGINKEHDVIDGLLAENPPGDSPLVESQSE